MRMLTVIVVALIVASVAHGQTTVPADGKTFAQIEASIAALSDSKNYAVAYDKFDDETTVNCDGIELTDGRTSVRFGVVFMFHGRTLTARPSQIAIQIQSESKEWRFLRLHKLDLLVDGRSVHLGEGVHEGSVRRGGVWEIIVTGITFDVLEELASAKVISLRLGINEFTLGASHLQILKAMYSLAWLPPVN